MKALFALALVFVSTAAQAAPQVYCYLNAGSRTNLDADLRIELCRGSQDNTPVDCYLQAGQSTNLSVEQRIRLCTAAHN